LKTDTTTAVFYLGTTAMGSGSFYCSGHRRISAKKEEIRRKSRTCQELSRKKRKNKREEEQEEVEEEAEELASDSSYDLEPHNSTRSSSSSEEEDGQEDNYKNKK
jgi:hypothetical protein